MFIHIVIQNVELTNHLFEMNNPVVVSKVSVITYEPMERKGVLVHLVNKMVKLRKYIFCGPQRGMGPGKAKLKLPISKSMNMHVRIS